MYHVCATKTDLKCMNVCSHQKPGISATINKNQDFCDILCTKIINVCLFNMCVYMYICTVSNLAAKY